MQSTVDDVKKVFEDALFLISDRDLKYGERWREEPMPYLWGNVFRKAEGLRYQVDKETFKAEDKHDLEQLLDLINYTAFVYKRLKK